MGINRDFSTNIAFDVPNELERANIKQKLQRLDLDLNIIQKEDILKNMRQYLTIKVEFFNTLFSCFICIYNDFISKILSSKYK